MASDAEAVILVRQVLRRQATSPRRLRVSYRIAQAHGDQDVFDVLAGDLAPFGPLVE